MGTKTAVEMYGDPKQFPNLLVAQHAIERAVRALDKIEAIALIRAAYHEDDGSFCGLAEARMIYASIVARP
jgi:hypothetical protein